MSTRPYTPLEHARRQRRWSQEELAARAGVSAKTVMRAERGESPRVASMRVLADALDVSARELWPDRHDLIW